MSRTGTVPARYATIGELERGFLHNVRRFRRACRETAARTVLLSGPVSPPPSRTRPSKGVDAAHQQLSLLQSQMLLLQNMSAQILTNFPGDARATKLRSAIEQWLVNIEAKSEELRRDLGRTARKNVDRTVVVRNHLLMEDLIKGLKKNVGGITEMYLQGPCSLPGMQGQNVMCDVAYLRITDLKGPDGFVHPSFFVVTAHPTEPGNGRLQSMYVGASPDYRVPDRVRWLSSARSPAELRKVVMDVLLKEGVISGGTQRALPVPDAEVRFVHDNVKKTTVKGHVITVLVRDRSLLDETRVDLRRQLSGIVHRIDPRNRDVVRDRIDPARGTISLTFSLPGKLRGRLVDQDVLRKIGTMLDIDAGTMQRIRTAIEDPE